MIRRCLCFYIAFQMNFCNFTERRRILKTNQKPGSHPGILAVKRLGKSLVSMLARYVTSLKTVSWHLLRFLSVSAEANMNGLDVLHIHFLFRNVKLSPLACN